MKNMLKSTFFYPDLCGYWNTFLVPISSKTYLFNVFYEIIQKCIIQWKSTVLSTQSLYDNSLSLYRLPY